MIGNLVYDLLYARDHLAPKTNLNDLSLPPGFNEPEGIKSNKKKKTDVKENVSIDLSELKVKKAWEIATAPAKSIPMTLIMSYMTGNSLQIIPISMTMMLLWNPIKAIFIDTNRAFKDLSTGENATQIFLIKTVFIFFQLLNMGVGVWKLFKMGLIPSAEGDWLAWKISPNYEESIVVNYN